jgi:predicted XRE-type DNA-binding protein
MNAKKRKKLEAAGYKVTDAAEWLDLSPEEEAIVSIRVNFAMEIERVCKARGITQQALAEKIGTRQSGVARMLNHPAKVTIDNLVRTLLALGTPRKRIASLI